MAAAPLRDILDELARWTDGILAMGLAAVTDEQNEQGTTIALALDKAQVSTIGSQLVEFLKASPEDREPAFGRLLIALELAREALQIDQLRQTSPSEVEEARGEEEAFTTDSE